MSVEAFSDFDNKMTSGDDTVAESETMTESESEGYQTDLQVSWLNLQHILQSTLYLDTKLVYNKAT